ncbi:hypothetical protein [Pseudomonas sp. efr-133-TYG-5]|uniref:hypothetical protein n=1 Tax=Pseudomonas sp. efr-133-TYG-5 TaxID=3040310 RepID=UPI0025559A1B|nr:hypothetical protein [Pseudomonas sp. efr-133-TYG-5]
MKDFIALGFIVALIGATSAIANQLEPRSAVAATHVGQSGTLNVDTVNRDNQGGAESADLVVAQIDAGLAQRY